MTISRSHYRRKVQAAKSTNRTIAIIVQSPPVLSRMREIFQYCNKLKINNSSKFKKLDLNKNILLYLSYFMKKEIMPNIKYFISLIVIFIRISFPKVYGCFIRFYFTNLSRSRVSWYYIIILHNRSQLCLTNVRAREGNVSIINSACDLLPNYVCRSVKHVAQLPNLTMIRICAFFALHEERNKSIDL